MIRNYANIGMLMAALRRDIAPISELFDEGIFPTYCFFDALRWEGHLKFTYMYDTVPGLSTAQWRITAQYRYDHRKLKHFEFETLRKAHEDVPWAGNKPIIHQDQRKFISEIMRFEHGDCFMRFPHLHQNTLAHADQALHWLRVLGVIEPHPWPWRFDAE